jgi:hypothetical protein
MLPPFVVRNPTGPANAAKAGGLQSPLDVSIYIEKKTCADKPLNLSFIPFMIWGFYPYYAHTELTLHYSMLVSKF